MFENKDFTLQKYNSSLYFDDIVNTKLFVTTGCILC